MAFNDGIKVGPIAYIGLVSVIVTFAFVLALQVIYYQQTKQIRETDLAAEVPPAELTELTASQQTALMQPGYVDREQGLVSVGIERAKDLVLGELAQGKTPSEVNGPTHRTAPAAAPAAEPAAEPAAAAAAGQPAADTTQPDTAQPETAQPDANSTDAAADTNAPPPEQQEPEDEDQS